MPKLILSPANRFSPSLTFLLGSGQKLAVIAILLFWTLCIQAQTLCQQHGSEPVNVTIGTPINGLNQQSVTFLSTLYPNGATFQNQKIRINGILKIDRNLSLYNCRVEMERGAQIVTDGANWILGVSTRFYS